MCHDNIKFGAQTHSNMLFSEANRWNFLVNNQISSGHKIRLNVVKTSTFRYDSSGIFSIGVTSSYCNLIVWHMCKNKYNLEYKEKCVHERGQIGINVKTSRGK